MSTTSGRSSLPDGVTVSLSRARVRDGAGDEATRWMGMLDERLEECAATLGRERMAIEIIFRLRDGAEDHLYWVAVHGDAGASVVDSQHALDLDHLAFDSRVRDGGWTRAEPQLLLLPEPVRREVLAWADHGSTTAASPANSSRSALVRPATVDDLDDFRFVGLATWPSTYGPVAGSAFVVASLDQYWSPDALRPALAADLGLVATVDGRVIGVAQVDQSGSDLVLWKLYVVPWHHRQGIGRQLLDAVRARARALGLGLVTEYITANTPAGAFYRASGFTDIPSPTSDTDASWLRLDVAAPEDSTAERRMR